MAEETKSLYDVALERYEAGEGPDTLIPVFKEICDRFPKRSGAWSSLAWLYMLADRPEQAYKVALKSVKLDASEPQNCVNLAIAMLATGKPGVREQIQAAQNVMSVSSELENQVKENLEEGLSRKPDWDSLKKVKSWLFPNS
jgi:predicted Zn-dependent protease